MTDKSMTGESLIAYPCDYPVKVLGNATGDFEAQVVAVARRHDPALGAERISRKHSRTGKYLSVTLMLTASSEAQITALVLDLQGMDGVHLVL
ncbi:MAG: YbeD family protein [Pseudomonadales bacterium]